METFQESPTETVDLYSGLTSHATMRFGGQIQGEVQCDKRSFSNRKLKGARVVKTPTRKNALNEWKHK